MLFSLILLVQCCGRRGLNLNTATLRFTTIPLAKTEITTIISEKKINSNYCKNVIKISFRNTFRIVRTKSKCNGLLAP